MCCSWSYRLQLVVRDGVGAVKMNYILTNCFIIIILQLGDVE